MKNQLAISLFAIASSVSQLIVAQTYPAEIFLTEEDDASFTVGRTLLEDASFEYTTTVSNPDLLDLNWIVCNNNGCQFEYTIKKDGPVDFSGINVSRITPYGYVGIVEPNLAIDFSIWGNTEAHIANVFTFPSLSPTVPGAYVPSTQGNSTASITLVEGNFITVRGFFVFFDMLPGATTQYQKFQVIGSGVRYSPLRLFDGFFPWENYVGVDGNKGIVSSEYNGVKRQYEWSVVDWKLTGGHYAALRFFTNGPSQTYPGLDLSGYTTLTVELACKKDLVVEAFMGNNAFDSTQAFLQDIQCDGKQNTYVWDISSANRSRIQTGFWLHVPTWKNTSFGQTSKLAY